jgi:hypothetical protein
MRHGNKREKVKGKKRVDKKKTFLVLRIKFLIKFQSDE